MRRSFDLLTGYNENKVSRAGIVHAAKHVHHSDDAAVRGSYTVVHCHTHESRSGTHSRLLAHRQTPCFSYPSMRRMLVKRRETLPRHLGPSDSTLLWPADEREEVAVPHRVPGNGGWGARCVCAWRTTLDAPLALEPSRTCSVTAMNPANIPCHQLNGSQAEVNLVSGPTQALQHRH